MATGHAFWFFGLSGAGKTTLATGLGQALRRQPRPVLALDGDVMREGLCRGLGFSDADRRENIRRSAEVARLAITQGQLVVAAFITPREDLRLLVRDIVGADQIDLIWVDTPLADCRRRDPKGLYRRSAAGDLPNFTGVSAVFEPSTGHDFRVQTQDRTPEELIGEVTQYCLACLAERGL